jgi:hypothetical protein
MADQASKDAALLRKVEQFSRDVFAGAVAASVAKTVNSPFEVAKLSLQTQPGRFNGLVDLLVRLPREVRRCPVAVFVHALAGAVLSRAADCVNRSRMLWWGHACQRRVREGVLRSRTRVWCAGGCFGAVARQHGQRDAVLPHASAELCVSRHVCGGCQGLLRSRWQPCALTRTARVCSSVASCNRTF